MLSTVNFLFGACKHLKIVGKLMIGIKRLPDESLE